MDFCRKQVKSDCEELLTRFQKTESVRFDVFIKVWREMNFAQIFCGTLKTERRSFSRLILDMACSFFLPPFSFQIRVGGLYLMFSLFHCQGVTPPEQIRLALKDWEDVEKFEKDAVDAQHLDAVFLLRQLLFHKAFHFTAMPTLLFYNKKKIIEHSAFCEEFMERASRPQELININLLEELSNIHKLYEKQKTDVSDSLEHLDSSVNLIHKDLVPRLRSTVADFSKWQQQRAAVDEDDEDGGEGTSSQQTFSRRAELLASIKSKAYRQTAEASKSRRHRQVEVNDAGPSHPPGYSKIRKLSLKARTNMYYHSPDDVCKVATQISRLTSVDWIKEKKTKYTKFKW
ncbi:hypothetical protein LDENG_00154190 [Lucifuga dentata]|nr:hypothetical protein LDENG_00154190 [Lucifuga dentata]